MARALLRRRKHRGLICLHHADLHIQYSPSDKARPSETGIYRRFVDEVSAKAYLVNVSRDAGILGLSSANISNNSI